MRRLWKRFWRWIWGPTQLGYHNEQFRTATKDDLRGSVRWNPAKVRCACGFRGDITECGRTHFPPDNIGWDCPKCHGRVKLEKGRS